MKNSPAGILLAVLVGSLELLAGCGRRTPAEFGRNPAGKDAAGDQLSVVAERLPEHQADNQRCIPKLQYVLEKSRGSHVISSETVLVICKTISPADVKVSVGHNSITVSRSTETYCINQTYQLSPWKISSVDGCNCQGSDWIVREDWDYRRLRFGGREGPGTGPRESGSSTCSTEFWEAPHSSYLTVPWVTADAQRLEESSSQLGNCALSMDTSGQAGYVVRGKQDSRDPFEVKVVRVGPHTLFVQVADPQHLPTTGLPLWNADHIEIWMGERSDSAAGWEFGIPLDEGTAQVSWGKPPRLPEVRRWSANLAGGRKAVVLRIELPAPEPRFTDPQDNMGLTVAYSRSREGSASERMVATSMVKPVDPRFVRTGLDIGGDDWNSVGLERSTLGDNSSEENITCDVVNGSLEIVGGPKTPIETPRPWHGK